jgi:hypothetical protein
LPLEIHSATAEALTNLPCAHLWQRFECTQWRSGAGGRLGFLWPPHIENASDAVVASTMSRHKWHTARKEKRHRASINGRGRDGRPNVLEHRSDRTDGAPFKINRNISGGSVSMDFSPGRFLRSSGGLFAVAASFLFSFLLFLPSFFFAAAARRRCRRGELQATADGALVFPFVGRQRARTSSVLCVRNSQTIIFCLCGAGGARVPEARENKTLMRKKTTHI